MNASDPPFINVHTHSGPVLDNETVIRNAFTRLTPKSLEALPYGVSIGLHPWHLHTMSLEHCYTYLMECGKIKNVLAIGEIGLDRAISTPLEDQIRYFEIQVEVAHQLNKPVIIHSVRSYSDLMPYVKKSKVPYILHGFTGNRKTVESLLKYNCYLSFGKLLFNPRIQNPIEFVPLNRLFLETDTDRKHRIDELFEHAATLRKLDTLQLKVALWTNYSTVFDTGHLFNTSSGTRV